MDAAVKHDKEDYLTPISSLYFTDEWEGPKAGEILQRLKEGDKPIFMSNLIHPNEIIFDPLNVADDEVDVVIKKIRESMDWNKVKSMLKQFKIPDGDVIRVDSTSLRKVVKDIFVNCGVPELESEIGSDVLISTDLRGVDAHGVSNMLRIYVKDFQDGKLNPSSDNGVANKLHRALWTAGFSSRKLRIHSGFL